MVRATNGPAKEMVVCLDCYTYYVTKPSTVNRKWLIYLFLKCDIQAIIKESPNYASLLTQSKFEKM